MREITERGEGVEKARGRRGGESGRGSEGERLRKWGERRGVWREEGGGRCAVASSPARLGGSSLHV